MGSPVYLWLSLLAIAISAWLWARRYKNQPQLPMVFVGGITGAYVGAKIAFLLVEGGALFGQENAWLQLAAGKSITGALAGGYAGVEIAKHFIGYCKPTGDFFALMTPISLVIGRFGCLSHGCCQGMECDAGHWFAWQDSEGVFRWPSVPTEIAFNLLALVVLFALRKVPILQGQLFHLYLIAYGLFRFAHEFVRDTPKIAGSAYSGYQLVAIGLIALGAIRYGQRLAGQREALDKG